MSFGICVLRTLDRDEQTQNMIETADRYGVRERIGEKLRRKYSELREFPQTRDYAVDASDAIAGEVARRAIHAPIRPPARPSSKICGIVFSMQVAVFDCCRAKISSSCCRQKAD